MDIVFVLDQPQDIANVGGVVRAMGNFGLARLRLVEPAADDPARLAAIAHQGGAIIAGIRRYPDLPAALADCGLVAATTGRPRRIHHRRLTPRSAAPVLHAAARPDAPVAVLFGTEKDGLANSALATAHLLITIPTAPGGRSLNLAQAALLIAYELWLDQEAARRARRPPAAPAIPSGATASGAEAAPPALGAAQTTLFAALDGLLAGPGGVPPAHRAHELAILRAVLLRAQPRADEAARLTALFRRLTAPTGSDEPA